MFFFSSTKSSCEETFVVSDKLPDALEREWGGGPAMSIRALSRCVFHLAFLLSVCPNPQSVKVRVLSVIHSQIGSPLHGPGPLNAQLKSFIMEYDYRLKDAR